MESDAIQVFTTVSDRAAADSLAQAVLEERLGACVQIGGPVESRYWWNGRVESAQEYVLTIKTRQPLYPALEKRLLALHPYDQPEIVATPLVEVSSGYSKWMHEQLAPSRPSPRRSGSKRESGR